MARSDDAAASGSRLAPYFGLLTRRVQRARLAVALPHASRGDRLLDLGCGLTDLPARFPSYVGCDRNPLVLSEMRRAASRMPPSRPGTSIPRSRRPRSSPGPRTTWS